MTDPSREEELFELARARPKGHARAAFLDEACAGDDGLRRRVEGLLDALESADDFLTERREDETVGSIVGRYRLVDRLGEGGGGEVFLAEPIDDDLPAVALKIVKPGMGTHQVLARFALERRALSKMRHPGIAHVRDAGTTPSGRPYFAMELVDGPPLTVYADEARLDVPARLALFRDVCRAVHHAHQKGVIHRDLKPSNVLVAEVDGRPVPKVIDFGIAKAIGADEEEDVQLTRQGSFLGTLQYMSPEQAGVGDLDVDVRADIYALGVVLYELMTGTTPIESHELRGVGQAGIQRLQEDAPTPWPSRRVRDLSSRTEVATLRGTSPHELSRRLAEDLDWVVLKALDRDRDRRYASAWEMAEDVRRVLADEPVEAGPPSRALRLRKFVRRHRVAVGAASAVAVALLVAVVGTTFGYVEATAARDELASGNARLSALLDYERQRLKVDLPRFGATIRSSMLARARDGLAAAGWSAQDIDAKVEALDAALASTNLTSVASDVVVRELLEPAEAAADALHDRPRLQALLRTSLALTANTLGFADRAVDLARRALDAQREILGDDHDDTLETIAVLAEPLVALGRIDEAAPLHDELLEAWRRRHGSDSREALAALSATARLRWAQGRLEDAEACYVELLERNERARGPVAAETLDAANSFAAFLEARGRGDEALALYRRAYDGLTSVEGAERLALGAGANLGRLLGVTGQAEEAEALTRDVLARMREVLGDDHPDTLAAASALASVLYERRAFDEAIALIEDVLAGYTDRFGSRHPSTVRTLANLAMLQRAVGRAEDGLATLDDAIARCRVTAAPGDPTLAAFHELRAQWVVETPSAPEGER